VTALNEITVKIRYPDEVLKPGGSIRCEPSNVQELVEEIDRAMNASHFGGQLSLEIVPDAPPKRQHYPDIKIRSLGEAWSLDTVFIAEIVRNEDHHSAGGSTPQEALASLMEKLTLLGLKTALR
jgi:hypothetical protein